MENKNEEIKSSIERAVRKFMVMAGRKMDAFLIGIPERRVFLPVDDGIEECNVTDYRKLVHNAIPYDNEILIDTAELIQYHDLYDTDNVPIEWRSRIIDFEAKEYQIDEDIDIYKHDLIQLTGLVAEAQGDLNFDQEVFNNVCDNVFKNITNSIRTFSVYCPIMNSQGDFESITLPLDFNFKNVPERYSINKSEIIPINDRHIAGYYTAAGRRSIPRVDPNFEHLISHLLKIDILGKPGYNAYRQYVKALGRCLRLRRPEFGVVYMGPAFIQDHNILPHRFNIPQFSSISPSELSVEHTYTTETYGLSAWDRYTINEEEVEELERFINRYLKHLNAEYDTELSGTIRRYDKMFSNLYIEDKLVDCAIGLEGSLLRDIGNTSSFTFRLKLRGNALLQSLDVNRSDIQDFFKSLYYVRGEIVHNDRNIDNLIGNIDYQPPTVSENSLAIDYSTFAKRVLADTIISYIDIDIDLGMGVTETNKMIDDELLNTRIEFDSVE
ncbi:HEPN domain-containing protein [Halalkalicoccus jeotgali]|uniref:HEPN domain-containing protein n=1 Tax=Halalkalicoccus jeotgali TaxID=413810 RepID=UPI000B2EE9A0|nr:HEPN domain-containing protein [Halalkalicoccus jeotgali]